MVGSWSMFGGRILPVIFLCGMFSIACKSEATKQAEEQVLVRQAEERIREERALAEARRRKQILSNPGAFLQVGDLGATDKGIINSYRQLTKMSVTNKTNYPLTEMSGEVLWLSDQGEVREVTLFRLRGSLAPGDTKMFTTANNTLDSGTTESHAHKYQVSFKQVKFVDVAD
jgi:hypothetical protein